MSDVRVVPYAPEWEAAHARFAATHWSRKRRAIPEYIYWKFRGEPGRELPSFILAVQGEQVIGQLGLLPVNVAVNGKNVPAQWWCDLMLDHQHRGTGLAKKLYERADSYGLVGLGGGQFSVAAEKAMVRDGFVIVYGHHRYWLPISVGRTLAVKFPRFAVLGGLKHPYLWWLARRAHQDAWVHECDADETRALFTALDRELEGPHTAFDEAFLRWRFSPFKSYWTPPRVFRFNDSDDFFAVHLAGHIAHLTNYRLTSKTNRERALTLAWTLGDAAGAMTVSVIADPAMERTLRHLGAIKRGERVRVLVRDSPEIVRAGFYNFTLIDSDEHL
jgi:hypothetical protein